MADTESTKPYSCSVCGRKFGRGEHLRRHSSAHANVKPFQCKFCEKRFARKDVLYRHYHCCEIARAQASLPKIETRRACDRCKRFKSRCSGGIPCERCQQGSHVCVVSSRPPPPVHHEPPLAGSPTTTASTISIPPANSSPNAKSPEPLDAKPFPVFGSPNLVHPVQRTDSSDPFNQTSPINSQFDSLDWNFFYSALQDMGAPETMSNFPPFAIPSPDLKLDPWGVGFPGMVESFSPQNTVDETKLDWDIDAGFSLSQIDPFEYHRLKVVEYLRTCGLSPRELSFFSSSSVKLYFHAYFTRFNQHTPFMHMATFDVSKLSTSLYFAMLLLGALHCGEPETGEVMRSIWQYAESYVWAHANDIEPGSQRAVDIVQALFILAIFHIFMLREPGDHPDYDFAKLMNTAKSWKLFEGDRAKDSSQNWHTWIAEETKKRTAFFLWIMDCGLVMYFGDTPSIPIYEIRHTIVSHEDIWLARTAEEWALRRKTMPLNDSEFPLLMSMLVASDIPVPPANTSVLGNFCSLHGLHIHIWIQQQYEASMGENANFRSIVFRKRNEDVQTALRKWREGWDATLQYFPTRKPALYQKSALPFWFLAKYFNEVKDHTNRQQSSSPSLHLGANRQILSVGRLLRAIFMMIDNGKLNENSPTSAINATSEGEGVRAKASLDAMNINFIMYEKKD